MPPHRPWGIAVNGFASPTLRQIYDVVAEGAPAHDTDRWPCCGGPVSVRCTFPPRKAAIGSLRGVMEEATHFGKASPHSRGPSPRAPG
ncbi:hypothetical protein [Acidisphaera sp. S103]|uniref:hypothetical protein n=1 Tax=Acidisphaera sp. S103 TaxID=1747223 RepID=UPI00131E111C|nr:hypothetical protein [Acidisphaera sp. S103]